MNYHNKKAPADNEGQIKLPAKEQVDYATG